MNVPFNEIRIPERMRSFSATQKRTPTLLQLYIGRPLAPTAHEYQLLLEGLEQGDPAMDQFIQAAQNTGQAKTHWREFHLLVQGQIQAAEVSLAELRHLWSSAQAIPFEVDMEIANEGAHFIQGLGRIATDVLRDLSLMGGYLLPAFNQTLIRTADLKMGAASRLSNTSRWWLKVTEPNANLTAHAGFAATLQVRWIHAMVRQQISTRPDWQHEQWALPVNQVDMAATYLGFSLMMLLGIRKFGVIPTSRQSRAVMHLWKIIAWQMGVANHWLADTEKQAIVLLQHFTYTHGHPDHTSQQLAQALALEPLSRQFAHYQSVRQQWAYQRHLSNVYWMVGGKRFGQLGLKSKVGPLLTLVVFPLRTAIYYLQRLLPVTSRTLAKRGRLIQIRAVDEIHHKPAETKQASHPVNAS